MKSQKKWVNFLFSMKFALIILGLFVIVCLIGSVIPQGETALQYETAYPRWSGMLLAMGFDDVFHSWWFAALTAVLCVNLLGCSLIHFPAVLRRLRQKQSAAPAEGEPLPILKGSPEKLMEAMGFRSPQPFAENGVYGIRNRTGVCGSWLTHLGILIIIAGFALGQIYTMKTSVYGVPGEEKQIESTRYRLRIDDFSVLLRPDDTVEQYLAKLTLTDGESAEQWSGEASVNHPWDVAGLRLYQNSTGWAANMEVLRNEERIYSAVVCAGEIASIPMLPQVQIYLKAVYPDCVLDAAGNPYSASGRLEHPGYGYALFHMGSLKGEQVLLEDERITLRGKDAETVYSIRFTQPRSYTLIQIKRDPFTWLAGLGGGVLLIALFITFYLRTEEIWVLPAAEGFRVLGRSRKGSLLYREKLTEKIMQCNEVQHERSDG